MIASTEIFKKHIPEKVRIAGGVIAAIGALAGASVLTFGDSYVDILGDAHKVRSDEDIAAEGHERASEIYAEANISERYAMQYLADRGDGSGIIVKNRIDGNGIAGFATGPFGLTDIYYYGQDCLAGSSYDITPSEIRGRAQGEVHAVATLNNNDGVITIFPAASEADPLRFIRGDTRLRPADEFTVNTLEAYGCDPSINL